YSYDGFGNPHALTNGITTYVSNAEYAALGGFSQLQFNEGDSSVWETWYRDPATQRLTEAVTQQAGKTPTVDRSADGYDDSGNVTPLTDTMAGSDVDRQCFAYDYLQRLTEAWTSAAETCGDPGSSTGGPAPYWITEQYNVMGDRITQTQHGL